MSVLDQASSAGGNFLDPIAGLIKNPFSKKVGNNGEMPNDFPNGFVITEYVNGRPVKETQLQLLGNMMPMQPFQWGGEQRLVENFYPGNPEQATHVLGAREKEVTIHGRFKDKRYKDPSYYGVSYQFSLLVREMRRRGNLVKFGMHGLNGDWFRYGYIKSEDFKMNKLSYVDYEITFTVMSETQPKNNYFTGEDKSSPDSINNSLIASALAFQSTYSAIPKSMPQSIAGALNDIIGGVAKNVNLVTNFVGTVISTAQDIQASANRALGLIKNARTQLSIFRRQIGALGFGFTNLSSQGNPKGQATDTFQNISYLSDIIAALGLLTLSLGKMKSQITAISKTTTLSRHKVQSGDSLQRLASKYYGTQDSWKLIYDHNKLQSTALTPGAILEIPKL